MARAIVRLKASSLHYAKVNGATADNSTDVHRRPFGAARATRRCGAPLRDMAHRPGWAQGHVTYVRFVIRHCVIDYLIPNLLL